MFCRQYPIVYGTVPARDSFRPWVSRLKLRREIVSTLKTVTVAGALLAGATSLAMAQNGMPPSGYTGPGAYQSYKSENFRAPANANTSNNNMPPESYKGPGAYQSYSPRDFQQGNPGANAAASGGSGTHTTSQRTGSAENTQKVLRNQNGYRHVYAYQPMARCRLLAQQGRPLPAMCR